jgi:hypothetical protein
VKSTVDILVNDEGMSPLALFPGQPAVENYQPSH